MSGLPTTARANGAAPGAAPAGGGGRAIGSGTGGLY